MQVERADVLVSEDYVESASLTPEEIYAQVFREMRPRTPIPLIRVKFCRYANASAKVKLEDGVLEVRIADTLAGAPDGVMEALAEILLSKLFRRPVPAHCNERYRRYLNRRDVRRNLDLVRQIRGRKQVEEAQGRCYDLNPMFEELNFKYFHGLMARPILGWSPNASRTLLGHYDSSHNAIVLSRILDRPQTPRVAVEYVLFHEMLHLRYPVEHRGARRCVHTRAFKDAEKQFEKLKEAQAALRHL
ncbi:MAG: SprT-like domain-containing protein [Bryobacteraceae bacterium]